MRNLHELDKFRLGGDAIIKQLGSVGDSQNGCFLILSPIDSRPMIVLASIGFDWEHISVSRKKRCPNWPEMEHVRKLFFKPDETVMQLHVPDDDHINNHPFCLHLWRPIKDEIPRPPGILVGVNIKST